MGKGGKREIAPAEHAEALSDARTASLDAVAVVLEHKVHRVLCHPPIRGPFATANAHQPARRLKHDVGAGQLLGGVGLAKSAGDKEARDVVVR